MDLDRLQNLAEAKAGDHAERPHDKTIDRAAGRLNRGQHALIRHAEDAGFALKRIAKTLMERDYLDDQDYGKSLKALELFRSDTMEVHKHVQEIFDTARTLGLPHATPGHGYHVDDL